MTLILPTQLFEKNKILKEPIYIYEHPVFFTMYKYHKMKLVLHRASMKYYFDYLKKKYKKVYYIEYHEKIGNKFKNLKMYDPVDFSVMKDLKKFDLFVCNTPAFINTIEDLKEYIDEKYPKKDIKDIKKLYQTSFYIWQRKKLNILMKNGKPIGGKWTFDKENRLPFSNNIKDIKFKDTGTNKYIQEAQKYVLKHFPNNIGEIDLYLPIDFKGAKAHLTKFIKNRLNCFGPYQDAVSKDIIFGCHSVLSPLINIGLLTPKYVVEKILKYSKKIKNFSSLEGFIRQIIGWREYVRMLYIFKHKELSNSNYFNHHNKLKKEWFNATFFMEPINDIIKKSLKYGYAHHIERLMYIGNIMLLLKIKPKEVHDWFMIMFIDSYHVFMEPNVYGMSQFSAGDIMVTRPYFSSSNYILKMSSYKKGDWSDVFDSLYYNFINENKKLSNNYSLAVIFNYWKKKSAKEKKDMLKLSKKYLK